MVWWMHFNPEKCREGVHFGLKTTTDIVYETVNVIFECNDSNYGGYDIDTLSNAGVNIFNVDMTHHDTEFFNRIKNAVEFAQSVPKMVKSTYYTPIGLSVTISANDPIEIDDRVDIIILKDIMTTDELRTFKKRNDKFSSSPILFWPSTLKIEDLNELIKFTDGIILDPGLGSMFGDFYEVLQKCKECRRPVFFKNPGIIDDYYKPTANDRQLLILVNDMIKYRFDGAFFIDQAGKPPTEFIQAFVRATDLLEQKYVDNASEYFKLSVQMQVPVLQPYAVALAASHAALHSGARAIIVLTTSGVSARMLAFAAPPCKVLAITRHLRTARKLHLYRKVLPLYYQERRAICWQDECLAHIAFGTSFGLDTGLFDFMSKLVVLAPTEEVVGYCNSFQILTVTHVRDAFLCGKK
uniref:Pyruvate kinase C-terminal domain-containing protein n=1 Tax=Heliothis virescens TaxID=7102 RepID=A0A2A4JEA5_HELVI